MAKVTSTNRQATRALKESDFENFVNWKDPSITGIFGKRKCGKTYTQTELGLSWIQAKPKFYQNMYGYDPQDMMHGLIPKKNRIHHGDNQWAIRHANTKNSCFLLDDVGGIMETETGTVNTKPIPGLRYFLEQSGRYNNTIIYCSKGAMQALKEFTYYTTHVHMFVTSGDPADFKTRFDNGIELQAAAILVNAYCKAIGHTGYRKDDPRFKITGQGFPHIVIDKDADIRMMVNMNEEIVKKINGGQL